MVMIAVQRAVSHDRLARGQRVTSSVPRTAWHHAAYYVSEVVQQRVLRDMCASGACYAMQAAGECGDRQRARAAAAGAARHGGGRVANIGRSMCFQ